jgi:hypothetical protein
MERGDGCAKNMTMTGSGDEPSLAGGASSPIVAIPQGAGARLEDSCRGRGRSGALRKLLISAQAVWPDAFLRQAQYRRVRSLRG